MPVDSPPDISVVICTRNRGDSLRLTLDCLARAEKGSLRCEVVVVDNGENDQAREAAEDFRRSFPVHYLREAIAGKSHALNRALADAPLGEIVAVLDDDMSPEPGWFQGVWAICRRWPDKDFFSGKSYVVWPTPNVPAWCRRPWLRGWAFSVMDISGKDRPVADGRWFSGNHFWFRSRVLAGGRRFEALAAGLHTHVEMSEPKFMLQLSEEGRGGVSAADAACGHRIQEDLLVFENLQARAARVGRGFGLARLQPCRSRVKQAQLFKRHPLVARLYCLASLAGWHVAGFLCTMLPRKPMTMEMRLRSILGSSLHREYLRVAGRMDEYRPFSQR